MSLFKYRWEAEGARREGEGQREEQGDRAKRPKRVNEAGGWLPRRQMQAGQAEGPLAYWNKSNEGMSWMQESL